MDSNVIQGCITYLEKNAAFAEVVEKTIQPAFLETYAYMKEAQEKDASYCYNLIEDLKKLNPKVAEFIEAPEMLLKVATGEVPPTVAGPAEQGKFNWKGGGIGGILGLLLGKYLFPDNPWMGALMLGGVGLGGGGLMGNKIEELLGNWQNGGQQPAAVQPATPSPIFNEDEVNPVPQPPAANLNQHDTPPTIPSFGGGQTVAPLDIPPVQPQMAEPNIGTQHTNARPTGVDTPEKPIFNTPSHDPITPNKSVFQGGSPISQNGKLNLPKPTVPQKVELGNESTYPNELPPEGIKFTLGKEGEWQPTKELKPASPAMAALAGAALFPFSQLYTGIKDGQNLHNAGYNQETTKDTTFKERLAMVKRLSANDNIGMSGLKGLLSGIGIGAATGAGVGSVNHISQGREGSILDSMLIPTLIGAVAGMPLGAGVGNYRGAKKYNENVVNPHNEKLKQSSLGSTGYQSQLGNLKPLSSLPKSGINTSNPASGASRIVNKPSGNWTPNSGNHQNKGNAYWGQKRTFSDDGSYEERFRPAANDGMKMKTPYGTVASRPASSYSQQEIQTANNYNTQNNPGFVAQEAPVKPMPREQMMSALAANKNIGVAGSPQNKAFVDTWKQTGDYQKALSAADYAAVASDPTATSNPPSMQGGFDTSLGNYDYQAPTFQGGQPISENPVGEVALDSGEPVKPQYTYGT